MSKCGRYVLVSAGDPIRDEWTNVGVILFDENGSRMASGFDTKRAKARGDLHVDHDDSQLGGLYTDWAKTYADVEKARDSMGHCMSCIQFRDGGVTLLGGDRMDWFLDTFVR